MTTITIKVPGKAKDKLSAIVKEMGGEIISISSNRISKSQLLDEIKSGLEEVKAIRKGKADAYTMSDLLNGK